MIEEPDPAGIFAAALSVWNACHALEDEPERPPIYDHFLGQDGLMRQAMYIATEFEAWSCAHVCFDKMTDVWPYLLDECFGPVLLEVLPVGELMSFDSSDCYRVALKLKLLTYQRDQN